MQGQESRSGEEDIPTADGEANNITIDEIWAEIEQFENRPPEIQEGDVTAEDYAERFGMSTECARQHMRKMAKEHSDRWETLTVHRGSRNNLFVLRKKQAR